MPLGGETRKIFLALALLLAPASGRAFPPDPPPGTPAVHGAVARELVELNGHWFLLVTLETGLDIAVSPDSEVREWIDKFEKWSADAYQANAPSEASKKIFEKILHKVSLAKGRNTIVLLEEFRVTGGWGPMPPVAQANLPEGRQAHMDIAAAFAINRPRSLSEFSLEIERLGAQADFPMEVHRLEAPIVEHWLKPILYPDAATPQVGDLVVGGPWVEIKRMIKDKNYHLKDANGELFAPDLIAFLVHELQQRGQFDFGYHLRESETLTAGESTLRGPLLLVPNVLGHTVAEDRTDWLRGKAGFTAKGSYPDADTGGISQLSTATHERLNEVFLPYWKERAEKIRLGKTSNMDMTLAYTHEGKELTIGTSMSSLRKEPYSLVQYGDFLRMGEKLRSQLALLKSAQERKSCVSAALTEELFPRHAERMRNAIGRSEH